MPRMAAQTVDPQPTRFSVLVAMVFQGLRAFRRHPPLAILGGALLMPHFGFRGHVIWPGGFPKPKVVNRGGKLRTEGLIISGGTRLELHRGSTLIIGKGTFLNRNVVVVAERQVTIGKFALIGWDAIITDTNEHDRYGIGPRCAPVTIGDHAWIGARSIVLPGVTIGEHSIVGAGSVVTRDVAPYTLVAGSPARFVKSLVRESPDVELGLATLPLDASPGIP